MTDAKLRCPVDMGQTRRDITYKVFPSKLKVEIGGSGALIYIEYGRGPGKAPPVDVLKGWAKRVLGDESAAYPVAMKIKKKGIKARPVLRPAGDNNRDKALRIFRRNLKAMI